VAGALGGAEVSAEVGFGAGEHDGIADCRLRIADWKTPPICSIGNGQLAVGN
jgi:hypothetical protein